jgi:hypothetical protein
MMRRWQEHLFSISTIAVALALKGNTQVQSPALLRQPLAHVLAARMERVHQPGEYTGQEAGGDGKP